MDDFAGTQTPVRRLTDPTEAIAALELAVPGLASLRLPAPAVINWPALEAGLGVNLPADYKLLCEIYPPFVIGDFLGVGAPTPGCEDAWVQGTREELETIADWCKEADLTVPLHPYPAPGGLLPWAGSTQGDFFLWTTSPADPREWTVTVASRSSVWWHYTGGAVQFLAELVGGVLEPWALPRLCAEVAAF
ncbi:SMI1/KNR4 family protein [Kitasatospora sp. NPDC001175]|uniref:SMI1/KNR4 family protein n=1 Tax=Kitasatospora sp. NPDC001175 TaxID=3157103 RepID=UPI003D068419